MHAIVQIVGAADESGSASRRSGGVERPLRNGSARQNDMGPSRRISGPFPVLTRGREPHRAESHRSVSQITRCVRRNLLVSKTLRSSLVVLHHVRTADAFASQPDVATDHRTSRDRWAIADQVSSRVRSSPRRLRSPCSAGSPRTARNALVSVSVRPSGTR